MPAVTHRHLTIQVMQARLRLLMREPETSEILELRALHLEYLHRLLLMRYTSRPRKYQRRVRSLNNANGFSNSAPLSVEEIRLNSAEFGDLLERVTPLWPTTPGRGCKQAPISLQLACFLYRLAHKALPFHRVADKFRITRSSALNYFIRGAAAVAKLAPSVIEWPTEERRLAIKSAIAADYDIPNCVGFLDGVHVVLDRAPALEKQLQAKFYNRKGCYSLMMIASCDETKRFTYLQAGYNGAASDMRAQRECTLTTSPELLFSKGEYLLCDAGFKCTEYVLPLYKKPRNRPYEPHMVRQQHFSSDCSSTSTARARSLVSR
ncbi:uncharacterized protein COLE_02830 [Cutaneotrichosporon oleaginosum]|uniref:uncharacterized protein n=1 Tax=Cutaneotrichosporon oleaginosum TaxID=879819 RepID=UPI00132743AA|nr:hypothetical protein COLE_02830 [Cutaneotrichosporon oleaginosum]